MHSAPSVSYPVGRCRFAAGLLAVAWLGGAVVLGAWAWQVPAAPDWQRALAGGVLVAAGLLAAQGWLRPTGGTLAWSGAGWTWRAEADPSSGTVDRMLDLQRWLLVRWRAESGSAHWLWLERSRDPPHWDALRRAVYSRARTEPPQTPQTPPAPS